MGSVQEVRGLSELLKVMQALPPEMVSTRGGPVRRALYRAFVPIRDEARRRAPRRTGNLAKNIIIMRDRDPRRNGASERYIIGVRKIRWTKKRKTRAVLNRRGKIDFTASGDAYYWRYVELGTSKMRAEPFIRPAFEAGKQQALETFKDELRDGIRKLVVQLGGRA